MSPYSPEQLSLLFRISILVPRRKQRPDASLESISTDGSGEATGSTNQNCNWTLALAWALNVVLYGSSFRLSLFYFNLNFLCCFFSSQMLWQLQRARRRLLGECFLCSVLLKPSCYAVCFCRNDELFIQLALHFLFVFLRFCLVFFFP